MSKKLIALLLALVFAVSCFPIGIFAAEPVAAAEEPAAPGAIIYVESTYCVVGKTVEVDICILNNPGVAGAKFSVSFDEGLTLVGASEEDGVFGVLDYTAPNALQNGAPFNWDSLDAVAAEDGKIITLIFEASEDLTADEELTVTVSYKYGDIYDSNLDSIAVTMVGGSLDVIDYVPGDANGDGTVNGKDVTVIRRYNANWDEDINLLAADVNGDGAVNGKDVTQIRRYNANWDVDFLPGKEICDHNLIYSEAKDPTCTENGQTEFWYCDKCGNVYEDQECISLISLNDTVLYAPGHVVATDDAVAPTYDSTGLSEGSHCSVCGDVLVAQKIIPALLKDQYNITYYLSNGDSYLKDVIGEKQIGSYTKQDGLSLSPAEVPGYRFLGWYATPSSTEAIARIAVGEEGDRYLYAKWEKIVYTITFDSPDVPMENKTYTVDTGASLDSAEWYGYTFVGWSNDDGFIVTRIKPGTTGNITLHANWTSNRNKATSYSTYEKPIIIEDATKGQFLFVYNIGKIDNVPLYEIDYIGNTQKITINQEYEITDIVTAEQAQKIANSVSNATTRSSGWTLSEEWNQLYSSGSEYGDLQVKSEQRTDSEGNTVGGNYFVSNSTGGSSYVSTESGSSSSSSAKVTTEASKGLNQSYDGATETYADAKLGITNTTEASAGITMPVPVGVVNAGVKNTTTIGAEASAGIRNNTAVHADSHESYYVGTNVENSSSSYFKTQANQSSSWNSETGYNKSYETSHNSQVSEAISNQISKKTNYNVSDSLGGENSQTASIAGTESEKNEYSNTFMYSSGTSETYKKAIEFSSDRPGYYRLIMAGTVHVYGVVGYDVATGSYYTYTFNVLDDVKRPYLDYSKDNANFNDCENGIVTFEIPYEVNEYILGVTGVTSGVEVNLDGSVTDFAVDEEDLDTFDGTVTIPQYYSVDNMDDTYSAYKTLAITSETFKGNKDIKTVVLPIYITEIPDNAFEGCTNLETVIAYGITSIGKEAFKGCTSLKKFHIDNLVTFIGENAFEGVPEIVAMAANEQVAEAVLNSGAKKITLDFTRMSGSFDNKEIVISADTEYFALIGGGKTITNLQIESHANETFISNMTFVGNVDTPLYLNSAIITLARVAVTNAPGFALIVPSERVEIKLLSTIVLSTKSVNAVISKNAIFTKANPSVDGKLNVEGKYLVCGTLENQSRLTASTGVQQIDESTFNSMLTSSTVTFNANGGSVSEASKVVFYGQYYGTLPTPTRANHTFAGWFTEAVGGTKITKDSIVAALANETLYAHWTPNAFKLYYNPNGGTVSVTSKNLIFGDSLGTLPEPTRTNFTFVGWYDANGNRVYSTTVPTAAVDMTIQARWTPNSFTIYFDANGGTVSVSSKPLTFGTSLGTLPTPVRDYYNFLGWFDANGKQVTASTVPSSAIGFTVYAHWEQKPTQGWVKASDLPANAQVVSRKWTYTKTETTESTSATLSGWTQKSSYWKQIGSGSANYATFPSGFDKNNTYYKSFLQAPYSAYDNGNTKREVTNTSDGYIYWHWMYNVHYANTTVRAISSKTGTFGGKAYVYFYAIKSKVNCPALDKYYCNSQNLLSYNCHSILPSSTSAKDGMGTPRFFRFNCYLSSYVDYQKIYCYEKVTSGLESTTQVTNGDQISNVQEWVCYRVK